MVHSRLVGPSVGRGGAAILSLVVCAAVAVVSSTEAHAQGQASQPPSAAEEWVYTVRPGDTLWKLSREYLASVALWPRLQSLNRIADPLRLAPGTRVRIPFAWMRAQPAAARVVETRGTAVATKAGTGTVVALAPGLLIEPGDTVMTGEGGSATVELADGSRVLLGADGRIVFDVLSAFGTTGMVDTRLRLERGRTHSRVTPRRGRFRIWTPAAATVVRGTEFRAEFDETQRAARAEVLSGTVAAEAAAPARGRAEAPVLVNAGFGTTAQEGEAPRPPVALLPAPILGPEPRTVRRLPARIDVPQVPGAVAYHLEVAQDAQFLSLVHEGASATGQFPVGNLADGTYTIRVRGVDRRGLQGLDALSTLIVDARPEPPVLMAPAAGAIVLDERPAFSWSQPEAAGGYRLQLATRDAPDRPILDTVHAAGGSFAPGGALPPGVYVWRVATRGADGEEGPFGDWQSFTRREPPEGPRLDPPRTEADAVTFSWPAAVEGSRYRFQLARDAQFASLVFEQTVASPGTKLERPEPGAYYLRVQTIDPDGFEGGFGPTQTFEVPAPPPPRKKRRWPLIFLPVAPVVLFILLS